MAANYPFGAVRALEGARTTDYGFTGQKQDSSSALLFYGSRYYDSALQRFVQPDSLIPDPYNPQSLNRYAYMLNNPVRYTDPTGHWAECGDDCSATDNAPSTKTGFNYDRPIEDVQSGLASDMCSGMRCNDSSALGMARNLQITYGVRITGRWSRYELGEVGFTLNAMGSYVGLGRLSQLIAQGIRRDNPANRQLVLNRSGVGGIPTGDGSGFFASVGVIDFPDAAFGPTGYQHTGLFEPGDVGKWYTGHELGHVLVHGLRQEGVDLANLFANTMGSNTLHNQGPNEDIATVVGLGALRNAGMTTRGGFDSFIGFANNTARGWLQNGGRLAW